MPSHSGLDKQWDILVPEATTNLCNNGSFENGTTGWTASGTNTIAQSAAQQFAGVYSLLITYGNSTTLATYAIASGVLTASDTYTITARVYVPADWDGGDINLDATGFTSATITQVAEWDSVTGETGKWVLLQITLELDSDVTGSLVLETDSAPTGGSTVYLDAVQIENKAHATTFVDGTRDQFDASGGRWRNLDDDFGFKTGTDQGTGAPPLEMLVTDQALLPGDYLQGIKVNSRVNLTLEGAFTATDAENLHSQRQALIKALNSRLGRINERPQPRRLRYTGAEIDKLVKVYYNAGLGVNDRVGNTFESVKGLQFYAPDPFWYSEGDSAAELDTSDSATFNYIAGRVDGEWSNLDSGFSNLCYALAAAPDGTIYAGGAFTTAGGVSANRIAAWDGTSWSALGSGLGGVCYALAVGPDGTLYAGGSFTSAGGSPAEYVAKWDGSSWSKIYAAADLNDTCNTLTVAPDGTIYAGGSFTTAGGVSANRIAQFDGTLWQPLGTGLNDVCRDIKFSLDGGTLYAGGNFTTAGGVSANYIAAWDGTTWSALGSGFNNQALALAVGPDGTLYAGGNFTTAGGVSANYIAAWDGTTWSALGSGVDGSSVRAMVIVDNILIARGLFTSAGGVDLANGIARWNGSGWSHFPADFPPLGGRGDIVAVGDDIYIPIASGTATHAAINEISYSGTDHAYPVIEISRDGGVGANAEATIASIKNETTGAELFLNYALLDGETLTIDLTPGEQSFMSSFRGSVPNAVLPNSDVANFYLTPGNGNGAQENKISAYVFTDGAPAPTVTAVMKWRDTYQSYD
jgi:hypothetical protein